MGEPHRLSLLVGLEVGSSGYNIIEQLLKDITPPRPPFPPNLAPTNTKQFFISPRPPTHPPTPPHTQTSQMNFHKYCFWSLPYIGCGRCNYCFLEHPRPPSPPTPSRNKPHTTPHTHTRTHTHTHTHAHI